MFLLLQNCFSAIRGRGRFNHHPTTRQAAAAVSALSTATFLRQQMTRSSNVEPEEEEDVVTVDRPTSDPAVEAQDVRAVSVADEAEETEQAQWSETDEEDTQQSYHRFTDPDALRYVLGSLFHRLDCRDCKQNLCTSVASTSAAPALLAARTFQGAHLLDPNPSLTSEMGKKYPVL